MHAAQNTVPPNNELYCDISNDEGDELETVCLNLIPNICESTNKTKAMTVQSKSSQTKFLTTSQFQQIEPESKLTYVQFQTATFVKSTQVSNLVNVQNISTQTPFISHVKTKVLKTHSTQMGNTNTIGNKFPHMQKNNRKWRFF